MACDTPANLERLFAGTTTVELKVEASEKEVRRILAACEGIGEVTVEPGENGCCQVGIQSEGAQADTLCRQIFFAFAREQKAILSMTTARASLEDIFMELTAEEPNEEEEVTQ